MFIMYQVLTVPDAGDRMEKAQHLPSQSTSSPRSVIVHQTFRGTAEPLQPAF